MPIWQWKWIPPSALRSQIFVNLSFTDIRYPWEWDNGLMQSSTTYHLCTQWVRIVKFQNMRLSWFQLSRLWGDLVHMCADDAICGLLENMIGGKVLSAARWRNTHKEQHRKMEGFESLFLEIKPMILWMGIIVNEGRWKCVHLMLECSENLWLAFSNNHLPAVFTLTFGAEATIWWVWWHHVGNNFTTPRQLILLVR